MWTPDAYEGAPTIVTAFMSTGVKAAAFAAFARVFLSPLEPLQGQWLPVLSVIAGLTMIVGTVLGVVQTNIKRMLAYSSIAHAGYLLLGIIAANSAGKAAILFYLLVYAVSESRRARHRRPARHAGERARRAARLCRAPGLAPGPRGVDAGLPAVARRPAADRGVHQQVVHLQRGGAGGHYTLAIIGVLTSVVSVFFYLRIVVMMYFTAGPEVHRPRIPATAVAGLALATFAVFYLGILPRRVLQLALDSIATIF